MSRKSSLARTARPVLGEAFFLGISPDKSRELFKRGWGAMNVSLMEWIDSDSLAWKWNIAPWKTTFLYKQRIFHFHVSESGCI